MRRDLSKKYRNIFNLAVVATALLVCVFNPFALYASDVSQFDFDKTPAILSALLGFGALFSAITIYAIAFIKNEKALKFLAFGALMLLLIALIQTFLFPGNYGHMDHFFIQNPDFARGRSKFERILITLVLIAIATALAYVLAYKMLEKSRAALKIIIATLVVLSLVNTYSIFSKFSELNTPSTSIEAPYVRELMNYSKTDKNIVVIVLDAFSGSHIAPLLEQFPHFKRELDGFVAFPNTATTSSGTYMTYSTLIAGEHCAVPNMNERSGKISQKITECWGEMADALSKHFDVAIFQHAFRHSLELDVKERVEAIGLKTKKVSETATNIEHKNASFKMTAPTRERERERNLAQHSVFFSGDFVSFIPYFNARNNIQNDDKKSAISDSKQVAWALKKLLGYGVFRAAPEIFRAKIYFGGAWLASFLGETNSKMHNLNSAIANAAPLFAFSQNALFDAPNATFKSFHTNITHTPFSVYFDGKSCHFGDTRTAWSEHPHTAKMHFLKGEQSRVFYHQHYDVEACALAYLSDFVAMLKNAGAYDNTQIFVVSDHSGEDSINALEDSIADALFLFKDFKAKGELALDTRLMANYDIVSIFCENLPNGCPNVPPSILKNYPKNREIVHVKVPYVDFVPLEKWPIERAWKVKDSINPNNWKEIKFAQ